MTGYSSEEDVYEECGLTPQTIEEITQKSTAEVTALVLKYIESGDMKIKRILHVPITIRKERHQFDRNPVIILGPYEDDIEMYDGYDPENCVTNVYALYSSGSIYARSGEVYAAYRSGMGRRKLPYPKDCDALTESIDDMTAISNVVLTIDTEDKKAGNASIVATFSGAGSFVFPKGLNLDKRIFSWFFIGFWAKTDDKTATFTIKLTDITGKVASKLFKLKFNNTWEIVSLYLNDFINHIDWTYVSLQSITIECDKECEFKFDAFNFNDGIFWSIPEGLICWSDPQSDSIGVFEVTYAFDPYANETPPDLAEASAKLAAVKLLDYCIGARDRYVAFKQVAEDMDKTPDKEALYVTRQRIKNEAMEILMGIGAGTKESIGALV